MLEALKKNNKKVLVTIDEVISNKSVREFISAFQIFIRQDLPIYLIMTGLFKNIDISDDEASEMAEMTKGYSFAFQTLGYFTWENNSDYKRL